MEMLRILEFLSKKAYTKQFKLFFFGEGGWKKITEFLFT